MKSVFIAAVLAFSSYASAVTVFNCVNKSSLQTRLVVTLAKKNARLSAGEVLCPAKYIKYNPNSPKYEGWIRVAPVDPKGCEALGAVIVGQDQFKTGLSIHWVSLSKEVQAGEEGFAQLGFRNDADPGAGGTAKTFLRCFPQNEI